MFTARLWAETVNRFTRQNDPKELKSAWFSKPVNVQPSTSRAPQQIIIVAWPTFFVIIIPTVNTEINSQISLCLYELLKSNTFYISMNAWYNPPNSMHLWCHNEDRNRFQRDNRITWLPVTIKRQVTRPVVWLIGFMWRFSVSKCQSGRSTAKPSRL